MARITQRDKIISAISNALNRTMTLEELYKHFPEIPKPSVRRVVNTETKNKVLERVQKAVYKLKKFYNETLHTKRIKETKTVKPIHEWDADLEATAIGLTPNWVTISKIESILNPKLITAVIDKIGKEGIFLAEERVRFNIMGTEIKERTETRYNSRFDVTIDFVNNVGVEYQFKTHFYVDLEEWEL